MQPADFLGLDVGKARTGIARASNIARLVEPVGTVPTDQLLEELERIRQKGAVAGIVVGLPRNLNGDDTPQTQWVREWAADAQEKLKINIHFQDEALTTKLAETRNNGNSDMDAEAAAIILQDFLDNREQGAKE